MTYLVLAAGATAAQRRCFASAHTAIARKGAEPPLFMRARARALTTAPRPFDSGALTLGRACAPAKDLSAAQPLPSRRKQCRGSSPSLRESGREKRKKKTPVPAMALWLDERRGGLAPAALRRCFGGAMVPSRAEAGGRPPLV